MANPPKSSSRDALVAAALVEFGEHGRNGASTRDIAAAAGMPMSQITYHFGGKDGLYLACAERLAGTMAALIQPALDDIDARFEAAPDRTNARIVLRVLFENLATAMLDDRIAPFVQFMLREQAAPSEAFAIMYSGVMGQMLARIAHLLSEIGGIPADDRRVRVRAISLMGQIVAFRVARAAVTRFAGPDAFEANGLALIRATLSSNIDAICDRLEQDRATGTEP